ncbi:MAG: polyprenyl synthetase family protein [Methanocellales archaeon]|nr:polyprenyl synthetase family protein [Methanocellales archaeon]MDD3291172.1 polyprenyl synthetase family protein [Methanocellales archaeon]MDD5484572.1 polyprenyl synthetase family protein [Methanocellales archaeon]
MFMHILDEIKKRGKMVDEAIGQLLPIIHPEGLYQAARYLVDAGGKRIRPAMLMLAAESVGGDVKKVLPAAVSIELIHNFTLIHDDIMDQDEIRRGNPTVHVKWGLPAAILAGNTLYSKAFEIITNVDAPPKIVKRCLCILSKTCTDICEGQWMDMELAKRSSVSEGEYLKMVQKKTSVLFATSAMIGSLFGGATPEIADALWQAESTIGVGFQIRDDVLDLITPEVRLGKRRGNDLMEGKKTLIMIHALTKGVKLDALSRDSSREEIDDAVQQLIDVGSIDYAMEKAFELVEQGKSKLDVLPDSTAKELLMELADYMITRTY